MTRQFTDYRIVRGDTLESIALAKLSNTNAWRMLAAVNRLRYPFISDDPIAQYGSPLLTATTTAPIVATNTTYTLALPVDTSLWVAGNVLYVYKTAADGSIVYDALTIQSVDTGTGILTFTTAFANSYLTGTPLYLFIRPKELATSVLRTGDVLHIPSLGGSSVIAAGSEDFLDLLGTDIQLDSSGQVILTTNGDLQLVSGVPNLVQALTLRLNTPVGTHVYDPAYGNQAFDHVGESTSTYFFNLVAALVARAIVADPRIDSVTDVDVSQTGTVLNVDALVRIASASQLLRLSNVVLRLLGGA